ncbi:MAG: RdgB/HAM1 family non-canonical purine NTP pyrophosphatase [Ignavibacteriae bacterium]|nr:RdgB/HAM1 family non-canonical purine NTP pyrophosphatase [Ignavibacteriota bacterium]
MKVLLATNNKHKLSEMQSILISVFGEGLEILIPSDILDAALEVDETGTTLEDNAYLKAIALFSVTLIPTIADDTGLEIIALDNQPGVKSARYSGEHGNDAANREKVLNELSGNSNRKAQFRTVICFHDGVRTLFAEGICKGEILENERGSAGFGYDAIFKPDNSVLSFAEMPASEKNAISHRGLALQELVKVFEGYNNVE